MEESVLFGQLSVHMEIKWDDRSLATKQEQDKWRQDLKLIKITVCTIGGPYVWKSQKFCQD